MNCDICRAVTTTVLDCGLLPLANGYAQPDRREPLVVEHCGACNLYQLAHRVAPDQLFGDYAYRSATAGQSHFHALASACHARVPCPTRLIDIGGNDGTLLAQMLGTEHINVDPYAPAQAWPFIRVEREPWSQRLAARLEPAQIILATNAFAHLPDLHEAAGGIATALDLDGWAVIQAPWARDTFRYDQFDTLYHEHIYTLGIRAMRALFQQHGMDVHDVEYLPNVHGGSLRYWVRHGNDGVTDAVERLTDIENEDTTHRLLAQRYRDWIYRESNRVLKITNCGMAPIVALGAPAKATMYWAMTGTAPLFARIFDDAEPKWGKRVPGTQLVIEPFAAFPAKTTAPVVAMAWNARAALTARVRALGYSGPVL